VDLTAPSPITLNLYDMAAELVYTATFQGNTGHNTITWNLQNQSGVGVASGLYVFQLVIPNGFPYPTPTGKVAILH
jgi:hypothetical protein